MRFNCVERESFHILASHYSKFIWFDLLYEFKPGHSDKKMEAKDDSMVIVSYLKVVMK